MKRIGTATIIERKVKLPAGAKAKKPSKYRNEPVTVDGVRFASKREAARYLGLKVAQVAGMIRELKTQTEFALMVNGMFICRYRSDFDYVDTRTGEHVVEDVKGFRTKDYKLKKALMLATLGIEVREV